VPDPRDIEHPTVETVTRANFERRRALGDPTRLILVDDTDGLKRADLGSAADPADPQTPPSLVFEMTRSAGSVTLRIRNLFNGSAKG
jgi:hypothetical protein